jgi:MoaF C-terminal domain
MPRAHECRILNSHTLVWDGREQDARVTSVREGIYFVDFLAGDSVKESVNFYTWHCIKGSEAGLGDTDRCHYIKIAQDLYLFVWREKIGPTLGVILIDMNRLKTDGKIFGYNGFDFSSHTNFPVGALTEVINVTAH